MTTQQRIWNNRIKQGFNTTEPVKDIEWFESEVEELKEAINHHDNTNIAEELADVVIMCYGLAEMCDLDLESEVQKKLGIIEKRKYYRGEDGKLYKQV